VKAGDEFCADIKDLHVEVAAVQARVAAFPGKTVDAVMTLVGHAGETYEDLALRGEKLVKRVRSQKATKDLVAQAESTVALGKGAVTTARKAAADVERSAKATLTTGRKEAVRAATAIAESLQDEAKIVTSEVDKSVKSTRTAARRTTTTARKAANKAAASTKATTTSATK